jgi:hypothetical protein
MHHRHMSPYSGSILVNFSQFKAMLTLQKLVYDHNAIVTPSFLHTLTTHHLLAQARHIRHSYFPRFGVPTIAIKNSVGKPFMLERRSNLIQMRNSTFVAP